MNPGHNSVSGYTEAYAEFELGPVNIGACAGAEKGTGTPDIYVGPYIEWDSGKGGRTGIEAGLSTDGPFFGFFGSAARSLERDADDD